MLGTVRDVETGSTVNAVYLRVETYARTNAALANMYMVVVKSPGNNITTPAANAVGSSDDKRFVIHQEMVMLQREVNGNPRTIFNGVIVLPRGYRRFGINDTLLVGLLSPGVDADTCMQGIYKEYR